MYFYKYYMYSRAYPQNPLSSPFDLPHSYRDGEGNRRQSGLKDLPSWLGEAFCDQFIHPIVKQVCLAGSSWNNPSLSLLQREFNRAYPTHQIKLHSDDAVVVPVIFNCHPCAGNNSHKVLDTLRPQCPSKPNWEQRSHRSHQISTKPI